MSRRVPVFATVLSVGLCLLAGSARAQAKAAGAATPVAHPLHTFGGGVSSAAAGTGGTFSPTIGGGFIGGGVVAGNYNPMISYNYGSTGGFYGNGSSMLGLNGYNGGYGYGNGYSQQNGFANFQNAMNPLTANSQNRPGQSNPLIGAGSYDVNAANTINGTTPTTKRRTSSKASAAASKARRAAIIAKKK